MNVLKLISLLLDYPRDELWAHRDELLRATQDPALPDDLRQRLRGFAVWLLDSDSLDAQGEWIGTFDRGRAMSLLLFEHIHGESRDRGQAMVDLTEAYRKEGFELAAKELPDYLPLVLEFLSHQPAAVVSDWLANISHLLALLAARAADRGNHYQALFDVLVALAGDEQDWPALRARVREEERDDSAAAMDKVWEEERVRFGPDEASGPACGVAATPRHPSPNPSRNQIPTRQVS